MILHVEGKGTIRSFVGGNWSASEFLAQVGECSNFWPIDKSAEGFHARFLYVMVRIEGKGCFGIP